MVTDDTIHGIAAVRLDEVSSTNDVARALAEERRGGGPLLVTARHQRAGRGRGDNRWHSSRGDDLLLSLLWHPATLAATDQFALSMAAALATTRLISPYTAATAIKWPNDILVSDRKIGGILIENTVRNDRIDTAIIGIGVNINEKEFPPSLPGAVSLHMITGEKHDTDELLERLVSLLKAFLEKADGRDVTTLKEEYESLLYGRGSTHTFRTPAGEIHAVITGIDRWGRLLLTTKEGETKSYGMEEVHQLL